MCPSQYQDPFVDGPMFVIAVLAQAHPEYFSHGWKLCLRAPKKDGSLSDSALPSGDGVLFSTVSGIVGPGPKPDNLPSLVPVCTALTLQPVARRMPDFRSAIGQTASSSRANRASPPVLGGFGNHASAETTALPGIGVPGRGSPVGSVVVRPRPGPATGSATRWGCATRSGHAERHRTEGHPGARQPRCGPDVPDPDPSAGIHASY